MGTPRISFKEQPVVLPRLRVFGPELVVGLQMRFGLHKHTAEIAALLADGIELDTIGGVVGLTESSIRTYSKRLYAQLGVHTQGQVVAVVYKAILEARGLA